MKTLQRNSVLNYRRELHSLECENFAFGKGCRIEATREWQNNYRKGQFKGKISRAMQLRVGK